MPCWASPPDPRPSRRGPRSRLAASTSPGFAASRSTSTWGCRRGIPSRIARSSRARWSSRSGSRPSSSGPEGRPDGPVETVGADYEAAIAAAGGVDLQVLGIGRTGHIGFNEPGSSFASRTRVKTLTEQTRLDNARFFDSVDDVPMHCVTQGLGTILDARHLVLLAFGEAKAEAVAGAVEGPVTASVPGSAVQLHPHVSVIVDEAAASRLAHADYYRYAWEHRFAWERL